MDQRARPPSVRNPRTLRLDALTSGIELPHDESLIGKEKLDSIESRTIGGGVAGGRSVGFQSSPGERGVTRKIAPSSSRTLRRGARDMVREALEMNPEVHRTDMHP